MANITVCEILEDNVPGLQAVDPDAARRFGGNASVVDGTTPLVSKIKEWARYASIVRMPYRAMWVSLVTRMRPSA